MVDVRTPGDPPDITEAVHESAVRLLPTTRHEELPDGGIYDDDIAEDLGADLEVVRAALHLLGRDRLRVSRSPTDSWVVRGPST